MSVFRWNGSSLFVAFQIRSVQVLPVDYEIEYICRGNRIIVGPKVRKCLPDGTWTDLNQRSKCCKLSFMFLLMTGCLLSVKIDNNSIRPQIRCTRNHEIYQIWCYMLDLSSSINMNTSDIFYLQDSERRMPSLTQLLKMKVFRLVISAHVFICMKQQKAKDP